MRRTGLVSEGGVPATLLGTPVEIGDRAPEFALDRFAMPEGLVRVRLAIASP